MRGRLLLIVHQIRGEEVGGRPLGELFALLRLFEARETHLARSAVAQRIEEVEVETWLGHLRFARAEQRVDQLAGSIEGLTVRLLVGEHAEQQQILLDLGDFNVVGIALLECVTYIALTCTML